MRGGDDDVRAKRQKHSKDAKGHTNALQADSLKRARRMKSDARIRFLRSSGKAYDVNLVSAGVGKGLAHLFEHSGVVDRLKYRGNDYFPFFYYLRQEFSEVFNEAKLNTNNGITANH